MSVQTCPFFCRHLKVLCGFRSYRLTDFFEGGMHVAVGWNTDADLVPHPLAAGGVIEVLTLDGKAVDQCDRPACRTTGVAALFGGTAGLQEGGAKQADV